MNRRLEDGEPGPQLLAWLNANPVAQEILVRDFGRREISEQNLSEWRQDGFKDWQRHQEACDHVRRLADCAEALGEVAEGSHITDRLATVFAVELFKLIEHRLEQGGDEQERIRCLREGLREIRLLRRGDHNAMRLQMELERWERQREREDEEWPERVREKSKRRLFDLVFTSLNEGILAEVFGGGDYEKTMAETITRLKFGMPLTDLNGATKPAVARTESVQAAQTESNQIRPE